MKAGDYMEKNDSIPLDNKTRKLFKPISSLKMIQSDELNAGIIRLNEQIKETIDRDFEINIIKNVSSKDITFI